jgi:hypothetical protein
VIQDHPVVLDSKEIQDHLEPQVPRVQLVLRVLEVLVVNKVPLDSEVKQV